MSLREAMERLKLKAAERALDNLSEALCEANTRVGIRPKAVNLLASSPRVKRAVDILSETKISGLPLEEGIRLLRNRMQEEVPNLTDAERAAVCQLKVRKFERILGSRKGKT